MNRLLAQEYVNPYDVLEIGFEASDAEIKRRYKMLSMLVHPDKNKHERAGEAFHVLERAYKTLMDIDKRRTYQRVMREARESVEAMRQKENDRRMLLDLPKLPESTLNVEIQEMCKKLFERLEEKKKNFERLDKAYKQQQVVLQKVEKAKDEVLRDDAQEWEANREKRVQNWRDFKNKKSKKIQKQKKLDEKGIKKTVNKAYFERKAAPIKPEERPEINVQNTTQYGLIQGDNKYMKPLGIQDDYKKSWR